MKSQLPEDLRRPNADNSGFIGGSAAHIVVSIKGETRRYWHAVGDAAQAIKRIEQDLHDCPPDDWHAFRELWLAAEDYGTLAIGDSPQAACEALRGNLPHKKDPWLVLDLNRSTTRKMAGQWLDEDLGKYGTADM